MKLSEMNTVQMAKALCELAAPVGRLAEDVELMRGMADAGQGKNTLGEKLGALLPKVIPALLDKHFDDVVLILSALTGKSGEVIRAQKGVQTIRDIQSCFDGDLLDFFKSSAGMERTESQA